MKNNKNCLLFYFTGTGNTYLVAKTVSNVFEKNNINVELIKIENFIKSRLNNNTDKISSKNKFLIDKEKLDKLINQSYKEIYLIGLALPVALQGTYPFLWEFAKNLPEVSNIPIFFIDTMQSYSGGIVGPLRNIIKKKGYLPISAKEIIMPGNYNITKSISDIFIKIVEILLNIDPNKIIDYFKKIKNINDFQYNLNIIINYNNYETTFNFNKSDLKRLYIIFKGIAKTTIYANNLVNFIYTNKKNNLQWGYFPIFSDLMSLFSKSYSTWNLFRKMFNFKIDTKKCTNCGICVKICPVNNIKYDNNHFNIVDNQNNIKDNTMQPENKSFPVHGNSCFFCQRCISFCPEKAIYFKSNPPSIYRTINLKELIK